MKPLQQSGLRCVLLITPRSRLPGGIGMWFARGFLATAIKGVTDERAAGKAFEDLKRGKFVDPDTGKFVSALVESGGWGLRLRALGQTELGLAGANFWS